MSKSGNAWVPRLRLGVDMASVSKEVSITDPESAIRLSIGGIREIWVQHPQPRIRVDEIKAVLGLSVDSVEGFRGRNSRLEVGHPDPPVPGALNPVGIHGMALICRRGRHQLALYKTRHAVRIPLTE